MSRKTPPLCLRADYDDLLEMGTRIHYHHRAGVARWMLLHGTPNDYPRNAPVEWGWKIVEGTMKYKGRNPEQVPLDAEDKVWVSGFWYNSLREMFFKYPQAKYYKYWNPEYYPDIKPTTYNKTVMVWPQDGTGWIMGMVRRSIGESSRSYGHGENFEEGWHSTDMYVDLYVVKTEYEGTQYILCPLWAVRR